MADCRTSPTRPPISVVISDAHLGIWQEDARDNTFRTEVYAELIRRMRARGWSIGRNPSVHRHYRCLSANNRLGARGTLRCSIEIFGRKVSIEFWSPTAPMTNPNGRRYDFDKMKRMAHLDSLRVQLEFRRVIAWLETIAPVTLERRGDQDLTPMERIEDSYKKSWHSDKELGRPACKSDNDRTSNDGALLEHGQAVWLEDRKGRIIRGTAYYNINNMWWVVSGSEIRNESSRSIFAACPGDLRKKRNDRLRRVRLEGELCSAIQGMEFRRAQIIKTIIFGDEPCYMIWARDHRAYYCSQYSGYSADTSGAGRYTRAEAEAECRRVPHELEMVCPDGTRVSFDRSVA